MTPELLDVGRVVKPHGLDGELVVELWSELTARLDPNTVLDSPVGPLRVTRSCPFGERYLVRFEGVNDRNAAESLRGTVLRAAPAERPGVLWVHELVGAEVVDRGEVSRIGGGRRTEPGERPAGAGGWWVGATALRR